MNKTLAEQFPTPESRTFKDSKDAMNRGYRAYAQRAEAALLEAATHDHVVRRSNEDRLIAEGQVWATLAAGAATYHAT